MIAELIITVGDLDEALTYYTETVGLDYLRRVRVDGDSVVLLAAGSTRVALVKGGQPGTRVAFSSTDVGADHRRVQRRGPRPLADPARAHGGTVLAFSDPWGNDLAFWESS